MKNLQNSYWKYKASYWFIFEFFEYTVQIKLIFLLVSLCVVTAQEVKVFVQNFFSKFKQIQSSRGGSRAASKMECFVIVVNSFQPLTIITKHSILVVAAALDPPLSSLQVYLYAFMPCIFSEKGTFSEILDKLQ